VTATEQPVAETAATPHPGRQYWEAQGLTDIVVPEFEAASAAGQADRMRAAFYVLAGYRARTITIFRWAFEHRREPLAQATLRNLIALHTGLRRMREVAPASVPHSLALGRSGRVRLTHDLVVRVLADSDRPLDVRTVTERVNGLYQVAPLKPERIREHLKELVDTGHVERKANAYHCSKRPYFEVNQDYAALEALVGPRIYEKLESRGFRGLGDLAARRGKFRDLLSDLTGFGDATAALLLAAVLVMIEREPGAAGRGPWGAADLIGSPYPRPYQHEAFAIFRGYGYQGQVVEAPTGSGKTLIGMMCIQDWLTTMSPGQSILVLVPTVSYQQQWVGELCYKETGLKLPPHLVFTGTPAQVETVRARTGVMPAVLVMSYPAFAQTGSGVGKGGFDSHSIEIFLMGANVRYVIFDEVHKVVDDVHSVSAEVTRVLTEWLRDGSLTGAIGFSGTAAAYRNRFPQLGLELVHVMPAAELIAYGFVAPFAELGVPFAFSEREQRVRQLVDEYKELLKSFLNDAVGAPRLRTWFAELPMDDRAAMARGLLRMAAAAGADRDTAIAKRLEGWESGGALTLPEVGMVTILQVLRGWSDRDLLNAALDGDAGGGREVAQDALERANEIRRELTGLIYRPEAERRLTAAGFSTAAPAQARELATTPMPAAERAERSRDELAVTMSGLYPSLVEWAQRVGEGRVSVVRSILAAERSVRKVHGVIVFDAGTRIRWDGRPGPARPGYGGVAGMFSELLGVSNLVPMAALSSEIYLPHDPDAPLNAAVAGYIRRRIAVDEQGDALLAMLTQGIELTPGQASRLQSEVARLLAAAVAPDMPRGSVTRLVVMPLRRVVREYFNGELRARLMTRLSTRQYHLRQWSRTFKAYREIALRFERAQVSELQRADGSVHSFTVMRMPSGDQKQLTYDLTARIVDSGELPVNTIIVSTWARTGWNVIKPNVLIDATATRNVTAWQQLRGRSMRAMRTWTNDCYRLVLLLMGSRPIGLEGSGELASDIPDVYEDVVQHGGAAPADLDEAMEAVLASAGIDLRADGSDGHRVTALDPERRQEMVTRLMLERNKVTHIYELVKAYGSTMQIRYDRQDKRWDRVEALVGKHAREYAVNLFDGAYGPGEAHAPMVYAGDPRQDVPSALRRHLTEALRGRDATIVKGWLEGIAEGGAEDLGLE
jgi:superfamily II DNA or RNA helicase